MTHDSQRIRIERPILFSAPMVRAILEGTKTQTRRVVKEAAHGKSRACPYGAVGDRLWVRATCAIVGSTDPGHVLYRASGYKEECQRLRLENCPPEDQVRWRPSIHMPRWASRISLEITGARVERLQEISVEDCIAEGLSTNSREHDAEVHLRDQWKDLWSAINGADSWNANPWVWVIEFKRVES